MLVQCGNTSTIASGYHPNAYKIYVARVYGKCALTKNKRFSSKNFVLGGKQETSAVYMVSRKTQNPTQKDFTP